MKRGSYQAYREGMKNARVKEGDAWRRAAQRLARAIIRFQNSDEWVHTENTMAFARRVAKGHLYDSD